MRNKKIKNLFLASFIGISAVVVPSILTVSCSNSIEEKAKKIILDENAISITLNENFINPETTIKDLFTLNHDFIQITESENLKKWNNENDYKIESYILYVSLPKYENNETEINTLDVYVEVSGLGLENIVKKTIDLTKINMNKKVNIDVNSYFVPEKNEIRQNIIWKKTWELVSNHIKTLSITKDITEEQLSEKLNFKFGSTTNIYKYQTNLYCFFGSKESEGVYINIYTAKEQYGKSDDVLKSEICFKLFISWVELESEVIN